jgi:ferritin-like metal-binding protein YciE
MSDTNERDSKLVQYLNEAYGNERELETALQADIEMTTKAPYKKRLKQHLKETKAHAKGLERRIKQLGGGPSAVQAIIGKASAAAKGPLHALRGHGEQEKMLKNAKTQYSAEHDEISTYLALETFATKVGDRETAKLAREIRKDEERMAKFLVTQITQLSNAVALAEVPAAQRRSAGRKRTSRKSSSAKPKAVKAASAKAKKSTTKKSSTRKSSARKSSAKKAVARPASKAAKKSSAKKSTRKKAGTRK